MKTDSENNMSQLRILLKLISQPQKSTKEIPCPYKIIAQKMNSNKKSLPEIISTQISNLQHIPTHFPCKICNLTCNLHHQPHHLDLK
jgi:hypothetical protein